MVGTKTLYFDIETAPIIGAIWQKYEANMVWSVQDWYMLCFAYKWGGEARTHVVAQTDFKGYKRGSTDDKAVLEALHALFDEADVVVAHNGDRFDIKKSNSRFILNGFGPAAPYQPVDTLKIARRYFGFTSNKLDDLGEYLGLGRKLKTDKDLWRDCMAGDKKAWDKMKRYNKQDVVLLEKVYLKLLPWHKGPNRAVLDGNLGACPHCGSNDLIVAKHRISAGGVRKLQVQCRACGGYSTSRKSIKENRSEYV